LSQEVAKYDQKIVLEALHNCIAHQDYSRNGRILLIEFPEKLQLKNEGSFYEGKPEDYFMGNKTPYRYRNPFLAQAMVELNMIDTMGYGIHEMHTGQAKRYLPLPDFDLSKGNQVSMTLYGGVVEPAYSQLLMQKTTLSFEDILALDRVQKKLPLPDNAIKSLRRQKLIEGRKPNFHVSAAVAKITSNKEEYIRTRVQDDAFYIKLITDYLNEFGEASRDELEKLLQNKLSDGLDAAQKRNKVSTLLSNLKKSERIYNSGSRKVPRWTLKE